MSNEISYLPASLAQLVRLTLLELSDNALHQLPRAIGQLQATTPRRPSARPMPLAV